MADSGHLFRQWLPSANRWRALIGGLLALCLWAPAAQALVILQYHHVSSSTPAATSISPEAFEAQMAHLAASGFAVIGLPELLQHIAKQQPLPDRTALITFDDAYQSIRHTAHPILKRHGWPYVVFVSTEAVDQGVRGMLSWDDLRALAGEGVAIANHTVRHSHLVRSQAGDQQQWRAQVLQEIQGAQVRIRAEVGHDFKALAFPYGEFNQALLELLNALGFVGFGQQSGAASLRDLPALPRFPFGGRYVTVSDFAQKLQALPMPLAAVELLDERGQPLEDGVLPVSVRRPQLRLRFSQPELGARTACYVSQQGRAQVTAVDAQTYIFQAESALAAGRSRYNCTAPSAEPGRYHWFSMPFLSRNRDGSWPAEP